jgi:hypothetical protein
METFIRYSDSERPFFWTFRFALFSASLYAFVYALVSEAVIVGRR